MSVQIPAADADDRNRLDQWHSTAQAIARVLDLAQVLTQAGRKVDLAGIDGKIGMLCAQALDLPPERGRELVATLRTLSAKIDLLRWRIT